MDPIKKFTDRELLEHTFASLVWIHRRIDRMENFFDKLYEDTYKNDKNKPPYWNFADDMAESYRKIVEQVRNIEVQMRTVDE